MALQRDYATVSTRDMQLYANGSTGNDNNDGYDVSTPKATLTGVFGLVPDIVKHKIAVNLAGTFDNPGDSTLYRQVLGNGLILVDGGDDQTTVAGGYTADIHSTSTIGLSTAGWTVDAYKGYIVKITSGASSGEMRTIQGNSATTITPNYDFTGDPGLADFIIVRPTTTISGSAASAVIAFGAMAPSVGTPTSIAVQRLYFSGSQAIPRLTGSGRAEMIQVISDSTIAAYSYTTNWSGCLLTRYNPSTFAQIPITTECVGVAYRGAALNYYGPGLIYSLGSFFKTLNIVGPCTAVFGEGSRCNGMTLAGAASCTVRSLAGYARTVIDKSASHGIIVGGNSYLETTNYVTIDTNTLNGINVVRGGEVYISGTSNVLAGASNTAWGAQAYNDGTILVASGATPTMAGGSGEASIVSGSNTWANIQAGTVLSDAAYKALIRKY